MKLKSIRKIENNSDCYDITIPDNHNFFANGILVHNSSATIYNRIDPLNSDNSHVGVCTRNQEKKLEQQYTSSYKDIETGVLLHPYLAKDIFYGESLEPRDVKGWKNDATNEFLATYDIEGNKRFEPIITEQRDAWVDCVKRHGYLDKLIEYCKKYQCELALRGELIGAGNKGSGNKNNSDAKSGDSRIVWFGVDDLSSGVAVRIHYGQEHNLKKVCDELEMEYTEEIFEGIMSYDDIIAFGNKYFKDYENEHKVLIEGIVIRSKFSNALSTKYLSDAYDSRC